ncbi:MAG: ABC transporter permease [Dehalococcoidia bacterium]
MLHQITRRVLFAIPTVLIVSFLVFSMIRFLPGDIAVAKLGEAYTEEAAQRIRAEYGLDKPWPQQYITYLADVLRGDLGTAESGQPVLSEIRSRFPVTFELAMLAVFFSALIGIPLGVLSAIRQDTPLDYIGRSGAIIGLAVPGFVLATLLQSFFSIQWGINIASVRYHSFSSDPLGNLGQMWIPALLLSLGTGAQVMRMTRAMMLEVQRQDYIRTATAKGLRERVVLLRHALRNALMPVVTIFGLQMAFLIGGTVIFESIFSLPGMGRYLIEAVTRRDYAVVQGITLIFATGVVLINLLVDLSYTFLDPRTRAG